MFLYETDVEFFFVLISPARLLLLHNYGITYKFSLRNPRWQNKSIISEVTNLRKKSLDSRRYISRVARKVSLPVLFNGFQRRKFSFSWFSKLFPYLSYKNCLLTLLHWTIWRDTLYQLCTLTRPTYNTSQAPLRKRSSLVYPILAVKDISLRNRYWVANFVFGSW